MRLSALFPADAPVAIGSYVFTEERIIAFARQFDPQFFHTDVESARTSLFGGLCASGWHVCSAAMRCNVDHLDAVSARIASEGGSPPSIGPSPGVRNLKWLKPVFAGSVVDFTMRVLGDTPVPGKPDRLFTDLRYEGVNQNGEMVIAFESRVVEFI